MQEGNDKKLETESELQYLPIQENICRSRVDRDKLRSAIQSYVIQENLVAPLSLDELSQHASQILSITDLHGRYRDFTAVLLHNELWSQRVSEIPYDRRLLLLPRCLRNRELCKAKEDRLGLICAQCGNCAIHDLQTEAEQLGYMVMVAEGSPVVMALIESGKIETVIGVSCLSVLARVFPYMEAAAVPGIAIPLLRDECVDAHADMDWIWDAIYLNRESPTARMDLNALKREVQNCFDAKALESYLGVPRSETEEIALRWMEDSGKRWRPYLTACVFQSLQEDPSAPLPESIFKLLVAIECFHKASLIHDDIEDNDALRYGQETLHIRYGIPVALNVGDLLVGDGYRLIADLDIPDHRKVKMLEIAALGHRTLCRGQGAELCWRRHRSPLTIDELLDIYKQKTAPAFEVALRLGAFYAGADDWLDDILQRYSEALGIAYQIRDDYTDSGLEEEKDLQNHVSLDITLLTAIAYSKANEEDRNRLRAFWQQSNTDNDAVGRINDILKKLNVIDDIEVLFQHFKNNAYMVLSSIRNTNLKCVLHRVIGKIFCDIKKMGCCNDDWTGNASSRKTRGD